MDTFLTNFNRRLGGKHSPAVLIVQMFVFYISMKKEGLCCHLLNQNIINGFHRRNTKSLCLN